VTEPTGARLLDLGLVRRALAAPGPEHRSGVEEAGGWDQGDGHGRPLVRAAVLVPLFEEGGEARVLLTVRAAELSSHAGQVAFPGGSIDAGESEEAAALREAEEEIGLDPAEVEVVARLERLPTVSSRFVVTPLVGLLAHRPRLRPQAGEVEAVFDVALSELLGEGVQREERWPGPSGEHTVYFYELGHHTVWGATARILNHLLAVVAGYRET
jgi:8-oxo-dGTP pyrophosphatase MutT (NUDIX family)